VAERSRVTPCRAPPGPLTIKIKRYELVAFRRPILIEARRDIVEALCGIGRRTCRFRCRQLRKRCLFEGKNPIVAVIRERLGEKHVPLFASGTTVIRIYATSFFS